MKTAIYLLAGFLGAGKTSTLRNLIVSLPDGSDCLAIVNEAGAMGLDGKLVEKAGLPVRELRNGCICCSLQVDFIKLLEELFNGSPPRKIFMEASGLADVNKLIRAVDRFSLKLEFSKTIVVLDAAVWEIREAMGDFFYSQLAAADLLILNKADLYPEEAISEFIAEIRLTLPGVNLAVCSYGRVEANVFLAPPQVRPMQSKFVDSESLPAYKTYSFSSGSLIRSTVWDDFIKSQGPRFERIKGQLNLDTGQIYFDYVRGLASSQEPLAGISGSRLVFIGSDINEENLEKCLRTMLEEREA